MAVDREGMEFLAGFFGEKSDGYLVDVGAHAGTDPGSMTAALIERGWGGLLIEPLPEAYYKLSAAYFHHPKVWTLPCACSNENGEVVLYPCKGVSTLEPAWRDACAAWWKHVTYGAPIKVCRRRLDVLLEENDAPERIDLLQIDTEGHDLKVLQGMDWTRRPSMVGVETLDMLAPERKDKTGRCLPHPDLDGYLVERGYELLLTTRGGNGFYARRNND